MVKEKKKEKKKVSLKICLTFMEIFLFFFFVNNLWIRFMRYGIKTLRTCVCGCKVLKRHSFLVVFKERIFDLFCKKEKILN